MPKLTFKNGLPDPEEFREALSRAVSEAKPLDDLLELAEELGTYERKYEMPTEEFHAKYQKGLLGDELHWMEWSGTYELFMENKRKLELALMRAAVQQDFEGYEIGSVSEHNRVPSEEICRAGV